MGCDFLPNRTGRFKFTEERKGMYVLYVEYERWDMDQDFDAFKVRYWVRADLEDIGIYESMRHE
jgi:hypothetical protein